MTPHAKAWQKTAIAGPDQGVAVFDPAVVASIIKDAERPVLVLGATCLEKMVGEELYIDVLLQLAETASIPIVATAHSNKHIAEKGFSAVPVVVMPMVNLINRLEDDRTWEGLDGKGKPDLVIYAGVTTYYLSQMLSSNKNFSEGLKTLTLDNEFQPNARFSVGNLSKEEFKAFLDALIEKLSK
jgi:CO dehydrogenase/acetyl-CoA synthase complex epsilon subunit